MKRALDNKRKKTDKKRTDVMQKMRLRHTLRWRLTLFVFVVMLSSGFLTVAVYLIMLTFFRSNPLVMAITLNPLFLTAVLLCASAVIGVFLSTVIGKFFLRPIKLLIDGTGEIKNGNFKVQLPVESSPLSEMGRLTESFNEMARELDGIELFRNDFINNFSHEFKTPIVSIRGFAREMQYGDLPEEQGREYAKIIAEEADRLSNLASNVLELSRLENQQIVTDRAVFFLDEQLRQCILLQEAAWTEKNIDMIPELCEVRYFGNEELMSHIWTNLIGNAIKFTPYGGVVRVTLAADEDTVTVTVSDTGEGMTDEVQAHIFEKFYQGDPSHSRSGYGIGLTMAHRAVTLCGGSISVTSAPGNGTVFFVVLPR